MKNDKNKFRKLLKQPRWKIIVFLLVLHALLLWQTVIDYYFYLNFNFLFARRAFVKRTRQRAHWVGSRAAKPHRLAFSALTIILLIGIFAAQNIQSALLWSIGWGSVFSCFVIYRSFTLIFQHAYPQNQPHQRPQN